MTDPLQDTSRWTLRGSRFDNDEIHAMCAEMFEEWIESLTPDNPARPMYYMLPKPGCGDTEKK